MKSNCIEVEQLLFGYSRGHHLLASSVVLPERIQKTLEVLSDLSGPDVQTGFTEYITGYPLGNENYYTISKTWYANEMRRPGCVWTHMFLFKYEDLDKIKYCRDLLQMFIRPSINFDSHIYSKKINIYFSDNPIMDYDISLDKLKFIHWAVYNNDTVIIPADTSNDYINEAYKFWTIQDEVFMRSFSFCTGVLSNRNINKKNIDLQVIPRSLVRNISRQNKEAKVIDAIPKMVKYPEWMNFILNQNRQDIMKELYTFRANFNDKYLSRKYINKFAPLYIGSQIIYKKANLKQFLNMVANIFLEADAYLIKNTMIQQLLNCEHLDWFGYKSIVEVILDLSRKIDLNEFNYEEINIDETINIIWTKYYNELNYIFKQLINGEENMLRDKLIKGFALKTSLDDIENLTGMDLELCNLMIREDNKFAMCLKIWQQSKDFQIEIINCIEYDNENVEFVEKVLIKILENSSFDLCDSIYERFGDRAITIFLDWYIISNAEEQKKAIWMKLCNKNPLKCIEWMINLDKTINTSLIIKIIEILDPYSNEIIKIDKDFWIDIFSNIDINNLADESKLILAQFFMPVILVKTELFPDDFVKFSFDVIYNSIATQKYECGNWEKLDKILPQVAWYSGGNKCKRLYKAMIQKGYKI